MLVLLLNNFVDPLKVGLAMLSIEATTVLDISTVLFLLQNCPNCGSGLFSGILFLKLDHYCPERQKHLAKSKDTLEDCEHSPKLIAKIMIFYVNQFVLVVEIIGF